MVNLKMCEVCESDEVLHPFKVCNSCHLEWLDLKQHSKSDWNDNRNYDYIHVYKRGVVIDFEAGYSLNSNDNEQEAIQW